MLITSVNAIDIFLVCKYIMCTSEFNHLSTLPQCHNISTFIHYHDGSINNSRLLPPCYNHPQYPITQSNKGSNLINVVQIQCLTIKTFRVGFTSSHCPYIPIRWHSYKQFWIYISDVHKYMSRHMLIISNKWLQYCILNLLWGGL